METRRSLGEDCLKDDECLSGVCSQLRCAEPPSTTGVRIIADSGGATATDGPTENTGSRAASDVVVETATETSAESSVDADLGSEGSVD
jgi:hypothetical protein